MERRLINTLIVNDKDLNCNCESLTIEDLSLTNIGFIESDLTKFDLIIYSGNKGNKILKSKYTPLGKIE